MAFKQPLEIVLGDVVRLRKPHPCGSCDWTVVRLGADIGLRCHGCERKVLLPRRDLEKRLKTFVSRGPAWVIAEATLADMGQMTPNKDVADPSVSSS